MTDQIRYGDKTILIKMEPKGSYGEDPGGFVGSDAIRTMNLVRDRYAGQIVERPVDRKTMGSYSRINASPYVTMSFDVEYAPSAAAAGSPAYSKLLRICGLAESDVAAEADPAEWAANQAIAVGDKRKVTQGGKSTFYIATQAHQSADGNKPGTAGGNAYWNEYTKSTPHKLYKPLHEEFESATIVYFHNANKQIITGCRGTFSLAMTRQQIPQLSFEVMGLYNTPENAVPIKGDISAYQVPFPVGDDNTPDFVVKDKDDFLLSNFNLTLGNNVVYRDLVNGKEVQISNRASTFSMQIQEQKISTFDLNALFESHKGVIPYAPVRLRHGPKGKRQIEFFTDGLQVEKPNDVDSDEVLEDNLTGVVTPEGPSGKELELRYI